MKEPWEWEEGDIEELINSRIPESLTLDYKASDSLVKEGKDRIRANISKDVSAFANSAGGTIIYGVVEEGHIPTKIDSGYLPQEVTREWLEQTINSTIQRRIDAVRIKQIELYKSNPGRVIYVVWVPQSNRSPHMASDNKFYKRFNYQSIPMEEYEVRDVANRSSAPLLKLHLFLPEDSREITFDKTGLSVLIPIKVNISNEASTPVMYYFTRLYADKRLKIARRQGFNLIGNSTSANNIETTIYGCNFGIPYSMPVWEGVPFTISTIHVQLLTTQIGTRFTLGWSVDAPGMKQQIGSYEFMYAQGRVHLFANE